MLIEREGVSLSHRESFQVTRPSWDSFRVSEAETKSPSRRKLISVLRTHPSPLPSFCGDSPADDYSRNCVRPKWGFTSAGAVTRGGGGGRGGCLSEDFDRSVPLSYSRGFPVPSRKETNSQGCRSVLRNPRRLRDSSSVDRGLTGKSF